MNATLLLGLVLVMLLFVRVGGAEPFGTGPGYYGVSKSFDAEAESVRLFGTPHLGTPTKSFDAEAQALQLGCLRLGKNAKCFSCE